MASKTSTLKLVIAGDNKGALKAVGGVEKGLGGLQGRLGGISSAVGGAFSVGAVTAFAKKSVDAYSSFAGSVSKTSRLTGLSAKNASLLSFATQQAGVDADKANAACVILAKNISNGKVAAEGVATKDAQGNLLSFDQILANVSDHYLGLKDATERTAFATRVMGRGAADVGKILGVGRQGIEDYRDEMIGLGLQLDEKGKKQFDDFIHTQRRMQAAIQGVEVQIGSKLAPAITTVIKKFVDMDPATRNVVLGVGGLTTAIGGLALGIGLLGPSLKAGFTFLNPFSTAASRAAAASGEMATAETAAAAAAATDTAAQQALATATSASTAAQEALAVALESGVGVTAAADAAAIAYTDQMVAQSLASEAAAASAEAMAVAEGEAAAATSTLSASLVAIAGPLAIAYGLYKGIKQATEGSGHDLTINQQKFNDLLGATNKELVKNAGIIEALGGGKSGFVAAGKDNIDVLYAMRDALKGEGKELPSLDAAIKQVEASEGRAASRKKKFGDSTGETTDKVKAEAAALLHLGAVLDATKIVDAAQAQFDLQGQAADATQAVADARTDLAEATVAASKNSDEYRAAVKQEQSDLKDLADAEADVTDRKKDARDAQVDETEAVKDAVRHQQDLKQAVIDTADAQRDAATAAARADFELRRKIDDPKASALDRREAQDAAIDAHHKASEAAVEAGRAAGESAAYTVNGDKAVVDAKQKVVDANTAIRDAEEKVKEKRAEVAADGQAKSKILVDAAKGVKDAQDKVNEALLTQAKLNADVVASQLGPLAGNVAFRKSLQDIYDALDPNSDLATRVGSFLAAIDRAISLQNLANPAITGVGIEGTGGGHPLPRPPDPGPTKSRRNLGSGASGNIIINQIHTGTPRQVGRASSKAAARELDKMFRGGR